MECSGQNLITDPHKITKHMADRVTSKNLWNSVISTPMQNMYGLIEHLSQHSNGVLEFACQSN